MKEKGTVEKLGKSTVSALGNVCETVYRARGKAGNLLHRARNDGVQYDYSIADNLLSMGIMFNLYI